MELQGNNFQSHTSPTHRSSGTAEKRGSPLTLRWASQEISNV